MKEIAFILFKKTFIEGFLQNDETLSISPPILVNLLCQPYVSNCVVIFNVAVLAKFEFEIL